jgi:hypothetical protein
MSNCIFAAKLIDNETESFAYSLQAKGAIGF